MPTLNTKKKLSNRQQQYERAGGLAQEDIYDLGMAIGQGMMQANVQNANIPLVRKETALTASVGPNVYGRYSMFEPCATGDVFGLQVQTHGLMNWIGWRANKFYSRHVDFLSWIGPAGTAAGSPSSGAVAPCDDPNSWEFGIAGYDLIHTSWYARAGEALSPHTIVQDRCEITPRYRINNTLITDDVEWQMNGIQNVLYMDMRRDLIHGSHSNANEMDGLESIIKTGYDDRNGVLTPEVDSILVNWAFDDLDGSVNGFGNFFNYLDEVLNEIEWRASAIGQITETDMVLFTSRFMATCILDAYACYTTCGVTSTSDITDQALRAQQRQMRMSLNGGPLYDGASVVGYIQLKSGRRLPIMTDDAFDITRFGATSNYCTDIYLLTRKVGSFDVLYGEYLDLRVWADRLRKHDPNVRARTDPVGRFSIKGKEDNFCHQLIIGTSPELYISAPWAQVRIQDICCNRERVPLTGDVYQPQYLPGQPLHTAQVVTFTSNTP